MTIVLAIGLFVELLLIIRLEYKVHTNKSGIFCIHGRVDRLTKDIMGSEESIKVLSDSVRKLNGVVKDLEQKQPKIDSKNRMNTRAFIAGWDANDPEDYELLEKERVKEILYESARQALNYYAQEKVNEAHTMLCQQTLLYDNYPTLLGQGQQCILQQTPTGSILPLWYINRRLEDM